MAASSTFKFGRLEFVTIAALTLLAALSALVPAAAAFSAPSGYVNDFADVISDGMEGALASRIAAIEKNSTAEIALVTVRTLENLTIEEYAVKLFDAWGIGKKGKDNGLLILVAPSEREWKIEVGYGLEGTINDAAAGRVGRECFIENFRAAMFGEGLDCAVGRFGSIITGGEVPGGSGGQGYPGSGGPDDELQEEEWVTLIVIIVLLVLSAVLNWKYGRRGGRRRHFWLGGFGGGGGGGFGGGGSGGGGAKGGW